MPDACLAQIPSRCCPRRRVGARCQTSTQGDKKYEHDGEAARRYLVRGRHCVPLRKVWNVWTVPARLCATGGPKEGRRSDRREAMCSRPTWRHRRCAQLQSCSFDFGVGATGTHESELGTHAWPQAACDVAWSVEDGDGVSALRSRVVAAPAVVAISCRVVSGGARLHPAQRPGFLQLGQTSNVPVDQAAQCLFRSSPGERPSSLSALFVCIEALPVARTLLLSWFIHVRHGAIVDDPKPRLTLALLCMRACLNAHRRWRRG